MRYEPLGKYVSLSQGLVVNKSTEHLFADKQDDEFVYPLLRIVDFESNRHSDFSKYVTKSISDRVIIDENTIVFTRVTCQCFRGFKGVVHNNLFIVKLISNEITEDYLYAVLQSSFVKKQALTYAQSSVVPDLTHEMFKSIVIPVPDRMAQESIASIYKIISEKIDINIAICSDLEAMAKLLYDYWFVQFNFPDADGKPYKSSGGKLAWNEELKSMVPEGWLVKSLRGLYRIERGISYTSDDIDSGIGIPMINLACIDKKREYRDGELKYYNGDIPNNAYLNAGDLLIACTDLTREREIIGCPILVPEDNNKYTYTMDMAKITFSTAELKKMYMYMTLRTNFYHEFIKAWASGTNVLHLNLAGLDWYTICVPPLSLQEMFSKIIKSIHAIKSKKLSENQQLFSLRDFLIPILMNGQVKIAPT